MVVISDKMEDTMYYDPVKLIRELGTVKHGIFAHGIHAYEKIAGENVALAIVKSDYVSKIIVMQILLVDVQYIIVRAENNIDIPQLPDFASGYGLQPEIVQSPTIELEFCVLKKI